MHKRKYFSVTLIPFIAIVAVFTAPYLAAHFFYSHRHLVKHIATAQHGTLIIPPLDMNKLNLTNLQGISFDQKQLRGKWLLLYLSSEECGSACQKNLYYMRQISVAMGKDASRIRRLILVLTVYRHDPVLQNLLQNKFRETLPLLVDKHELADFLKEGPLRTVALTRGYLYFVDPHGNMMMGYAPDAEPSGQFKDLKHLLRISQIG